MELSTCVLCHKNKTALRCDSCGEASCKKCVEFIDEDLLELIALLPEELKNKTFCLNCYNQGISEQVSDYLELVEKAKKVSVFSKIQSKETRRIKRIVDPVKVLDCEDRNETLMRLAILAVEKGFDTIVDVEIRSKKVGEGKAYKKLVWDGLGVPVDPRIKK